MKPLGFTNLSGQFRQERNWTSRRDAWKAKYMDVLSQQIWTVENSETGPEGVEYMDLGTPLRGVYAINPTEFLKKI